MTRIGTGWFQLQSNRALAILTLLATLFGATATAVAQEQTPEQMLEEATGGIFATLSENRSVIHDDPQHLFELVDQSLVPYVDLKRMSQWVLGRNWRNATAQQREDFTQQFRNLMVRFYVSALLEDPDQIDSLLEHPWQELIAFMPSNLSPEDRRGHVRSEVHVPDGPQVPVVFAVYYDEGKWRVIDVNVDGVSLVNNYRVSFNTEIANNGLDGLITRLAERNDELLKQAQDGNSEVANP